MTNSDLNIKPREKAIASFLFHREPPLNKKFTYKIFLLGEK